MPCDIYILAGENSGDLHGEKLMQALLSKNPELKIAGVGGPRMRALGMQCTLPMEKFQVMGFVDVFFALPKLMRQFYYIVREILTLKPKAVITIDYPGLHLRLAKHLKKKKFAGKLTHFICPSVWAWGKKRIPLMANTLDQLLTILPFEKEFFSQTTLPVHYVGHPLVERIHAHNYAPFAPPEDRTLIAIFPGSRKKEIERNLPLYVQVAKDLKKQNPDLHFAFSVVEERFRPLILQHVHALEDDATLVPSHLSYELMKHAHLAIAKSGTVTLELALHHTPTIVTYAISKLDVFIAYNLLRIRLPHYCLVNIIAGKEIFPELFGPNFSYASLMQNTLQLLDKDTHAAIRAQCAELSCNLDQGSTSQRAATHILQSLP